jgi:hypothetical protein
VADLLTLETAMALCLGIGLSAACGFRVFVPPLALGIAVRLEAPLSGAAPEWIGSMPALVLLGVAVLVELGAYYVPWIDNLLDTIASPAAVVAGILLTAGLLSELDPVWRWSLALIAGGGAAGITQGATVITRGLSSATTGGIGNPVVSTVENLGAVAMSLLAIVIAPLAVLLFVAVVVWFVRVRRRRRAQKEKAAATA